MSLDLEILLRYVAILLVMYASMFRILHCRHLSPFVFYMFIADLVPVMPRIQQMALWWKDVSLSRLHLVRF